MGLKKENISSEILREVNQLVIESKAHRIGAGLGATAGVIGALLTGPTIPATVGAISGLTLSGCMIGTMLAVGKAERKVAESRGIPLEAVRQTWDEWDWLVKDSWLRKIGQKRTEMMGRLGLRSGLKFLDRGQG